MNAKFEQWVVGFINDDYRELRGLIARLQPTDAHELREMLETAFMAGYSHDDNDDYASGVKEGHRQASSGSRPDGDHVGGGKRMRGAIPRCGGKRRQY